MSAAKILIALEDDIDKNILAGLLQNDDNNVVQATSLQEGFYYVTNNYKYDIIITDGKSENSSFELLRTVKEVSPDTVVILLRDAESGGEIIKEASTATKLGADDFIVKPFKMEEVRLVLEKTRDKINRIEPLGRSRNTNRNVKTYSSHSSSVSNPKMLQLLKALPKIAETSLNILIKGESGTGRESLAKTIHQRSPRNNNKFVTVNCADDQLEIKLFGCVRGANRDTSSGQQGLFEIANGGTIYLNQITDMPLPLQSKLFLVLKSKVFCRIGSREDLEFNIRIICASSNDLTKVVSSGHFREDLFYKLNLLSIDLPPLRERREDIPFLIREILQKKNINKYFTEDALRILTSYSWKGNIGELEGVIERIVCFSDHEVISPADIPANILEEHEIKLPLVGIGDPNFDLETLMTNTEKSYLLSALEMAGGNKTEAAKLLNISFRSLRHRLDKYNIQ